MFGIVRQPIVSIRSILSLQSSAISTAIRNTTQSGVHNQSIANRWSSRTVQRQTLRTVVQQHGPVSRVASLKRCSRPLFNQSKPFFSDFTTTRIQQIKPFNTSSYNRQRGYQRFQAGGPYPFEEPSAFRLLFPSFVFVAAVTGASWAVALNYPSVSQYDRSRLFPDFSVGVATAVGIIGINLVVFGLWRAGLGIFPGLLPTMYKYFGTLSADPRPLSMLGAVFSHQTPLHLLFNMYAVFAFGSDSLYLSAGVLSSWIAVAYNLARHSHSFGLGASGAIFGVFAAWTYMHSDAQVGFFFLPMISFPAKNMLIAATAYEVTALVFNLQPGLSHMAHLAGIVVGLGMMHMLYNHLIEVKRKQQAKRFRGFK